MALWLIVIIVSYLFFSLASLGDKLVLSGPSDPKSYVFLVGICHIIVFLLIPFVGIDMPNLVTFFWIILEALAFLASLYFMYSAVKQFDVSRVVPTVGAIQPIFIFFATWLAFGAQDIKGVYIIAFLLLLLGGFVISLKGTFKIGVGYIKLIFISSLMFSLDYVCLKFVFLQEPFWWGFIWTRMFIFFFSLFFLFNKNLRSGLFGGKKVVNKKTSIFFVFTQSSGAVGSMLQNFAIALVPVEYLAIMNSLRGIQYVFLFFITLVLSWLVPQFFHEEISKKIFLQKIVSIVFIIAGLAILVLY